MTIYLPESLETLWTILRNHHHAALMAGGTDLLVRLRARGTKPSALVCLEKISELQCIEKSNKEIRIGAGVTLTALLHSDLIKKQLPILYSSLETLGSPLIRNMGTLGGNICTASPAGDTLPALYALGARVALKTAGCGRTISLEAFIKGPGKTALFGNEILHSVIIPVPDPFNVHHFEKVGQRNALAIGVVSFAALLNIDKGIIKKARLAWGSVGPTIVQSRAAEKALEGQSLTLSALEPAAALARQAASPISDVRASADYRRQVAGNLLLRLAGL